MRCAVWAWAALGRAAWLARRALPGDERETVTALLRRLDFYGAELSAVERRLAAEALDDPVVRRLMTIPGVDAMTAVTVLAAVRRAGAGPLCESTCGAVWKSVRAKALRGKATTTLARRLYDLRHAGICLAHSLGSIRLKSRSALATA